MPEPRKVRRWRAVLGVAFVAAVILAGQADTPGTGATPAAGAAARAVAIFAGGCFWCMEPPFDALDGVLSTVSGYTGGHAADPTYEEVSAGGTGHAEAVQVTYDPHRIGYAQLLAVFWRNIDPTTPDRQFCDHGQQYRSAIFYRDPDQERAARASKAALDVARPFAAPIVTEIVPATTFYPAEDYHQDYYRNNPVAYKFYRYRCGRDRRLQELWGRAPQGTEHAARTRAPRGFTAAR